MHCFILRMIQLDSRDSDGEQNGVAQELEVRCGPLFTLTRHVMWKLFTELAMLYLLFVTII